MFVSATSSVWLQRRWAIAFDVLLMASVFLAPAAFLSHVLQAWACAVTALALGVVLTLVTWPAQRKYFGAIRARATAH